METIALAGNAMHALDADASARVRRRTLGFVFQAFHLIAHLSVAHNVAIPLLLNGIDQAEALRRASAMLGRLGLGRLGLGTGRLVERVIAGRRAAPDHDGRRDRG